MNNIAIQELAEAVHSLIQSNLRYEILLRSVIEVLGDKKVDGTPILTVEEINARAEQIKLQYIEQTKKAAAATNIIKPDQTIITP